MFRRALAPTALAITIGLGAWLGGIGARPAETAPQLGEGTFTVWGMINAGTETLGAFAWSQKNVLMAGNESWLWNSSFPTLLQIGDGMTATWRVVYDGPSGNWSTWRAAHIGQAPLGRSDTVTIPSLSYSAPSATYVVQHVISYGGSPVGWAYSAKESETSGIEYWILDAGFPVPSSSNTNVSLTITKDATASSFSAWRASHDPYGTKQRFLHTIN